MRFRMKPGMGKHITRQNGKTVTIMPGDIVEYNIPEELGAALFKFEALDPEPAEEPAKEQLFVQPMGDGTFDVVNPGSGTKVNDQPLAAEQAADLANVPVDSIPEPVEPTPTPEPAESDKAPPPADRSEPEPPKPNLIVQHIADGFYDVVDVDSGTRINDDPLKAEAAAKLAGIPLNGVLKDSETKPNTDGGTSNEKATLDGEGT